MPSYILLTHGKRHFNDLGSHPAARQQLANLGAAANRSDGIPDPHWDYARKHRSLQDLPRLKRLLAAARDADTVVIMDDLSRLFRTLRQDRREPFLSELEPFNRHLFGLRQRKKMSEMTTQAMVHVVAGGGPGRFVLARTTEPRSDTERTAQTRSARSVSARARTATADRAADEIEKVRDDLVREGHSPTQARIAEEANARGMRTTRGNPWTTSGISRALKRVAKSGKGAPG